ncbi:hypothetical protein HMPREF1141_2745 [Clostridium sp. MSTE9]|nr:hypothetical protein HMPREF1141_2745 [Clostridium sp. MSTE9]
MSSGHSGFLSISPTRKQEGFLTAAVIRAALCSCGTVLSNVKPITSSKSSFLTVFDVDVCKV